YTKGSFLFGSFLFLHTLAQALRTHMMVLHEGAVKTRITVKARSGGNFLQGLLCTCNQQPALLDAHPQMEVVYGIAVHFLKFRFQDFFVDKKFSAEEVQCNLLVVLGSAKVGMHFLYLPFYVISLFGTTF